MKNEKGNWSQPWVFLTILFAIFLSGATGLYAGQGGFDFERIDPPNLHKHPNYSQVTTVEGPAKFIFIAGQVDRPKDYTLGSNKCRHDDLYSQYHGTMENVKRALEAAGATFDDIVYIRRYLVDREEWMSLIADKSRPLTNFYGEGRRPPPSTMIEVKSLSEPCQLIETDVFAVVPAT